MLSKLFPRKINHSADSKSRGKDDMSDAQNISISGDKEGDEGVIKPIKSNISIPSDSSLFSEGGDKTVLGKVSDSKYNVVYFFVYSSIDSDCGVYAYDPYMYFENHEPESLVKVYTNEAFSLLTPILRILKTNTKRIQRVTKTLLFFFLRTILANLRN